jgi:hypothetical protein
MSVVGEHAHRLWRYQLGIAEGDSEIPSGRVTADMYGWYSSSVTYGVKDGRH